jgi:hypothetical protein
MWLIHFFAPEQSDWLEKYFKAKKGHRLGC